MTSREFAELIGVSQATVSRALNGRSSVCEKTRIYIEKKAEEYGFVLNSQARSLKTSKTNTIGVLFPLNFDSLSKNLMFTHIFDQLQRELSRRSYDIMIVYDHDPEMKSNTFERVIRSGKVDGLINFRPQLLQREIDLIEKFRIPFVSLHSALQESSMLHQLMIDEENAGFQIGAYLGGQDVSRYVYMAVDDEPPERSARLHGYMKGLASAGKALGEDSILTAERSSEAAYEAVMASSAMFCRERTGIFVYNDMMALGRAQRAARARCGGSRSGAGLRHGRYSAGLMVYAPAEHHAFPRAPDGRGRMRSFDRVDRGRRNCAPNDILSGADGIERHDAIKNK